MTPSTDSVFGEYEEYGVEDVRISQIDDEFLLTYSAYSAHGVRIGLAKTKDFISVERISLNYSIGFEKCSNLSGKINGQYVRLDRPHSEISKWSIWISYSPDLVIGAIQK